MIENWRRLSLGAVLIAAVVITACQSYEFVFQPDTDRQALSMRFTVQTPSQADIVFVVDNSVSMTEEQTALIASFEGFIDDLSKSDTAYRIGVVSTDAVGFNTRNASDCDGIPLDPDAYPTQFISLGNCSRPENEIAYPHDGARGRLLAAFDSIIYDINNPIFDALSADEKAALLKLFPTGVDAGPCVDPGAAVCEPFRVQRTLGPEWVIDRELTNLNACKACDCDLCERGDACFDNCATTVAGAYVNATFRANIRGLGIDGQGWEQGIRSGLLSVGVEPANPTVELALDPASNLTDPARSELEAPNTFRTVDAVGNVNRVPWVRDDALLAMMFVTDEQDCSMSQATFDSVKSCFEEGCPTNPANDQPTGSMCYQTAGKANLIGASYVSTILEAKKGTASRVALGVIAGLERTGTAGNFLDGRATDCVANPPGTAGDVTTSCYCVTGNADIRWCNFTNGSTGDPTCDGLNGDRYTELASSFRRRVLESVCESDLEPALVEFGNNAELSCFELLDGLEPADRDPNNIRVYRVPRTLAEAGVTAENIPPLERVEDGSAQEGWYFEQARTLDNGNTIPAQICLNRIDRLIGDIYDVKILTTDEIDFNRANSGSGTVAQ